MIGGGIFIGFNQQPATPHKLPAIIDGQLVAYIRVKDGSPYRSYLYAADLAVWLWTILFRGAPCRPYNVGSDQEITISQLAETAASVLGGSVESPASSALQLQLSTSTRNSSVSRYVPAVDRARSELGLRPLVSLDNAIQKTAEFSQKASSE